MHDTVIFDFDGTLADSERLMLEALNALAGEFGFAALTLQEIPQLRKLSARELVTKRLRIPAWKVWKLYRLEKRSKAEFAKRSAGLHVFPGMREVLLELRESGWRIGIVSSAAAEVVERVVREESLPADFVYAGSSALWKAHAIRAALAKEGIYKEHVFYVGDELRDAEACARVGILMIAVGWGLNDADPLQRVGVEVATTPQELYSMIVAKE